MLERDYQAKLIKRIEKRLPGCIVLKNDAEYLPGFPDLTVLDSGGWAVLEVKADKDSEIQPNQDYYVDQANGMSFGSFIHPSNEKEVLDALYSTLRTSKQARAS